MSEENEFNHTFVIDMNDPRVKLRGLTQTAKLLPCDYLESWLKYFTDMEMYKEAAVIKNEIEGRK